ESAHDAGLAVYGPATTATVSDLVLLDVATPDPMKTGGLGVYAVGAQLSLQRALIARTQLSALELGECTTASVSDIISRDHQSDLHMLAGGYGVSISQGTHASLSRVRVARTHGAGIRSVLEMPPTECPDRGTIAEIKDADVSFVDTDPMGRDGNG